MASITNLTITSKTGSAGGTRRSFKFFVLLVPSALPDLNRTDTLNSDVVGCFRCDRKVCDAYMYIYIYTYISSESENDNRLQHHFYGGQRT